MSLSLFFLAVTDAIKLQALTSFLLMAANRDVPFAASLAVLVAAVGLFAFMKRKRRAIYVHALAYLGLWAVAELALIALLFRLPFSVEAIAALSRGDAVGFSVALVVPALFIARGVWLAAKAKTHQFAVLRFDEGLAVFLCVFLIAAFLRVRAVGAERLVIPYFVFSMIALGLSKREHAAAGGLARASAGRLLAPVIVVMVLVAIGVIALIPALVEPARTVAQFLKTGGLTVFSYIAAFLQWLFGMGKPSFRREDGVSRVGQERQFQEPKPGLFATIMMYVFGALIAIVVAALVAYLVYNIWKLFTRRVGGGEEAAKRRFSLRELLARIAGAVGRAVHAARAWWAALRVRHSEAVRAFLRLRAAGRAVGLAQRRSETPREYGARVGARFPARAASIGRIVGFLEAELYGGAVLSDVEAREVRIAARGIRPATFVAERMRSVAREALRHVVPRSRSGV